MHAPNEQSVELPFSGLEKECMHGVRKSYLGKHAPVLCHISVPNPSTMQHGEPELSPHVSWHVSVDLSAHLQINHRQVIRVIFGGNKTFQQLEDSCWAVHGSKTALTQMTGIEYTQVPAQAEGKGRLDLRS